MSIDSDIRAIAASKGHTDLTPDVVRAVKQALANSYIDGLLDGAKLAEDIDTEDADDDVLDDDDTEDETDDKGEATQKLTPTKEVISAPPTTPTSAPNTSGQTGMGQAG